MSYFTNGVNIFVQPDKFIKYTASTELKQWVQTRCGVLLYVHTVQGSSRPNHGGGETTLFGVTANSTNPVASSTPIRFTSPTLSTFARHIWQCESCRSTYASLVNTSAGTHTKHYVAGGRLTIFSAHSAQTPPCPQGRSTQFATRS